VFGFGGLAGSVIGGLTTFAAAWITQHQQANVQWLLQEKTRRQELYQQFIEDASKLYVDALMHDQVPIPSLVNLYASMNKMKVVFNPGVAERAEKVIRVMALLAFNILRAESEISEQNSYLPADVADGTGCPSGRAGGTKYPSVNVFRNRTIWSSSASVKPRLPTFRLRF
jgi:hypothetical protein